MLFVFCEFNKLILIFSKFKIKIYEILIMFKE
ncbi:MAG: hypothetical protein ACI9FW_000982 [Flavobacterium sp.]